MLGKWLFAQLKTEYANEAFGGLLHSRFPPNSMETEPGASDLQGLPSQPPPLGRCPEPGPELRDPPPLPPRVQVARSRLLHVPDVLMKARHPGWVRAFPCALG